MRRAVASQAVDGEWRIVSGLRPCPVCGGSEHCRTHTEDSFACCVQQPSDWRLSNGGWLHQVETTSIRLRAVDRRLSGPVPVGVPS